MLLGRNILAVAIFALATSPASRVLAEEPSSRPPHLIMNQSSKIPPILGHTTSEKNLISYFGASNVKHQKVNLGEGETANGTVIYPNEPKRRASFVWKNTKK